MYLGANGWYWRIAFHQHHTGQHQNRQDCDDAGTNFLQAAHGRATHIIQPFGRLLRKLVYIVLQLIAGDKPANGGVFVAHILHQARD
ncbi:hypothetical protein B4Q13_21915, partial [Lacticaseibacillus rhamnosus]